MTRTFISALVAAALLASTGAQAQQRATPRLPEIERRPDGTPELVRFPDQAAAPREADAPAALRAALQLSSQNELRPSRAAETDALGFTSQRYQQFYQGVPVEFTAYTTHSRAGKLEFMTGEVRPLADGAVNVQPTLTAATALKAALAFVHADQYMWQLPNEGSMAQETLGKPSFRPTGSLVIVDKMLAADPAQRSQPALAWKFDVYAAQPLSRSWIYVDAHTGTVVNQDAILKDANATATYTTRYSGTRTLANEKHQTNPVRYRLHDYTRGAGIRTYNANRSNVLGTTDFTDANNSWTAAEYNNTNQDWVAGDAHFGAQCTYDYWLTRHNRNSFNGSGALLKSYVHYDDTPGDGKGLNNAFWDGSVMKYGDGYVSYSPLTSLDVCGHEIGHAICQYTANLKYENESGGLNEGFSDIWGACVEQYAASTYGLAGKDTWLIGEEIRLSAAALRSMRAPKDFNQPNTYQGVNWVYPVANPTGGPGGNDFGGVHTNSGVLNYWFYLLSQGGSGTNDKGTTYNLVGIGLTDAAKIAYATEKLLSPTSGFLTCRSMSLQAVTTLFGTNSVQKRAVENAWAAVGIDRGTAYGLHNYFYVDMVALNSLARSSADDGGYFNSAIFNITIPTISRCAQQTLLYSARYFGTHVDQYWNAYIDYNQDGDFGDANERVVSNKLVTTDGWVTSQFVVPSSATLGVAKMRVVLSHVANNISVGNVGYGEVEDYWVNVTAAQAVPMPTNLHVTNLAATTATVNWNAVAGAASYTVRYRVSSSPTWTLVSVAAPYTGKVLTNLAPGHTYYYSVQAINGCGTTGLASGGQSFATPSQRPAGTTPDVAPTPAAIATAYPNPATDALHLTLTAADGAEAAPATVEIYDLRGARVAGATYDGNGSLNVSALTAGLYSATLRSANGTPAHVRFVKE